MKESIHLPKTKKLVDAWNNKIEKIEIIKAASSNERALPFWCTSKRDVVEFC